MVTRYFTYLLFVISSNCFSAENGVVSDLNIQYFKSGIEVHSPNIDVQQRELITINVELFSNEEFSYLSSDTFQTNHFIVESKLLANNISNRKGYYKKHMRIFIWPLEIGSEEVQFPAVNLVLSGRVIKTIELPQLKLNVSPLPAYLPPGFPVGEIIIESEYLKTSDLFLFTRPNEFSVLKLTTKTSGIHSSLVPDYSTYLTSNDISNLSPSKTKTYPMYDLSYSYISESEIPVITKITGWHVFDDFRILYFNPIKSKIYSGYYDSPTLISLNAFIQSLLYLIFVYLLYKVVKITLLYKEIIKVRRSHWVEIYNATNFMQLSLALRNLPASAIDSKQYTNITLSSWSKSWGSHNLDNQIQQLLNCQFSKSPDISFDECKNGIIGQLLTLDNMIFYTRISR